jgi:hypothetical protein
VQMRTHQPAAMPWAVDWHVVVFSYKIDVDIRLHWHTAVCMSQERRLSSTSAFFPSAPRQKTSDREVGYPRSSNKAVGIS